MNNLFLPLLQFKPVWKHDISAGIVLFFVSLPMSMGIAEASGFPAYAGIVSSIAGALVIFLFNTSKLAVKGAPAGLSAVILEACIYFSKGDLSTAYNQVLTVIFLSGLLILFASFINAGMLAQIIPTSVVSGMLSALGLIIAISQLGVLLGSNISKGNHWNVISHISEIFATIQPMVALIGIISLTILIVGETAAIKKAIKVPAMLIMIPISVLLAFVFQLNTNMSNMVQMTPPNMNNLPALSIQLLGDVQVWAFAIIIAAIAIIESTLTLKAIDKTSNDGSKSHYNRDLAVNGIGTIISSLLGGLTIISVVRRSMVNIQAGAKSPLSAIIQGVLLILVAFFGATIVALIPNAALAAVLVYSGIKFVTPSVLFRSYKIGVEQGIIFSITFLGILFLGIIQGVVMGILAEFIIALVLGVSLEEIFNPKYQLYYSEHDKAHVLSINGAAIFSNFFVVNRILIRVPKGANLIFDFANTIVVDHTFMEQLYIFEEKLKKDGGQIELRGMEKHKNMSTHPLSARRISKYQHLDDRELQLAKIASFRHGTLDKNGFHIENILSGFTFSKMQNISNTKFAFRGEFKYLPYQFAEVLVKIKNHKGNDENLTCNMLIVNGLSENIPDFTLEKETYSNAILSDPDLTDINFQDFPNFSYYYLLKGADEKSIRNFFTGELLRFFESHKGYAVEVNNRAILIIRKMDVLNLGEIDELFDFAGKLVDTLQSAAHSNTAAA